MKGRKPHVRVEREELPDRPAPIWLSAAAREEWARIVPILAQRRVLTEADVGILENYCSAIGTVREMEAEIQKTGAIQKVFKLDKDGTAVLVSCRKNPAVSIRSDAMTQARLMAAELGATPVSRSRPSVEDNGGDADLFEWGGEDNGDD